MFDFLMGILCFGLCILCILMVAGGIIYVVQRI